MYITEPYWNSLGWHVGMMAEDDNEKSCMSVSVARVMR